MFVRLHHCKHVALHLRIQEVTVQGQGGQNRVKISISTIHNLTLYNDYENQTYKNSYYERGPLTLLYSSPQLT